MHDVASTPDAVDFTIDEDGRGTSSPGAGRLAWLLYLATGMALGIIFIKSEVVSWYRIQEMFRFESFHLYGVIGVAIAIAAVTQHFLVRSGAQDLGGAPIAVAPKLRTPSNARYWLGGVVFGLGWSLLGACPGPIFTLIGAGHTVYVVPLASAAAGTYLYAAVKAHLPH